MKIPVLVHLLNALGLKINPATEEKQDSIITAINNISGGGDYITKVDVASGTITYVGVAVPTSTTSTAVWKIMRIDTTSGVTILFADGNGNYDNIWDNRSSLSYS